MKQPEPIDRLQLKQIQAAYAAGFRACAEEVGLLKPYMSLYEAQRKYGRATVDRWIDERLVDRIKDGTSSSKIRIKRSQIELVAATANRASWYEHHK